MNDIEIIARLEKALMDAADAADEAIGAAVDVKSLATKVEILSTGILKTLRGLLPNVGSETLVRYLDDLKGACAPEAEPAAGVVPPSNLPAGHDGVGPAPDAGVSPSLRRPFQILAEDHDLKLSRFAGSNHVLVAGCREESDGSKTVWRIEVDKPSGEASCQSDAGEVFRVISGSGRRSELIAVHGLLTVMRERARRNK